ncbi:MAG: ATP-dependent Clp protease proteolytic subunit, partial [archaeon]
SVNKILEDFKSDVYMTSEQAVNYGIIDKIISIPEELKIIAEQRAAESINPEKLNGIDSAIKEIMAQLAIEHIVRNAAKDKEIIELLREKKDELADKVEA